MALRALTKTRLAHGLANNAAANEIVTIINAKSGTLSAGAQRYIKAGFGNNAAANQFITSVNAASAFTRLTIRILGEVCGDQGTALDIDAALP